jgi:hypothetical protein
MWFDYPQEALDEPDVLMPLSITKEGRVWGHVAAFNECHIGIPGKCQIAPHHFRAGDKGHATSAASRNCTATTARACTTTSISAKSRRQRAT